MLSVSFFLRTPNAISQSQVYISISNKEKRLQFASGVSFIASYCNIRKRKGTKELVKKNTVFYFEYTSKLREIRDSLIRAEMDLSKAGAKCALEQVRDTYYIQIGKQKGQDSLTFFEVYDKFLTDLQGTWGEGTKKKFAAGINHLKEFEKLFGEIRLNNINEDLWNCYRDRYFVDEKKFSNPSINKYMKGLKQFLRFAKRKGIIKHNIDFEALKFLDEIEPFKIALKESEVDALMKLDLSSDLRLDRVRDLFALEILTGQRWSDMPKVLDSNHFSDTNIQIYQQKTGERVTIPLHPKLKKHLAYILKKYPEGFPTISNQKFNEYLKEVCIKAEFNRKHSWVILTGKQKISQTDFRYNLITSHTGRRTFCTLALNSGINAELIMKVTGHRTYDQFREYVKVDDTDLDKAFEGMFNTKKGK
jgi:integrase